MLFYEITDVRNAGKGAPTIEQIQTYRELEQRLQENYVSHGNNLIHALDETFRNQVSPTRDIEVGRGDGRHLNVTFIRSLVFGAETYNKYNRLYSQARKTKYNYLPKNVPLQLLYQSIIYLYKRDYIEQLRLTGNADYMELAKDSRTHVGNYKDPNEFLGEYYVYDRREVPDPDYILIGAVGTSIQTKDRVNIYKDVLPELAKTYPNTKIVYFPNVTLHASKELNVTGNLNISKTGINVLKRILSIDEGRIKPTQQNSPVEVQDIL